jgi:hypothetical protein
MDYGVQNEISPEEENKNEPFVNLTDENERKARVRVQNIYKKSPYLVTRLETCEHTADSENRIGTVQNFGQLRSIRF